MPENVKLSENAKAIRAAYMREYRRQHPDKMREYERRKWERRAAEQAGNVPAERTETK